MSQKNQIFGDILANIREEYKDKSKLAELKEDKETLRDLLLEHNTFSPFDIEEIYSILTDPIFSKDYAIKFNIYNLLRAKRELIDLGKLANIFNVEKVHRKIFLGETKKVFFPIARNGLEPKMAEALIVEVPNEEGDGLFSFYRDAEFDEAFRTIRKVTGKNFFVIFDRIFKGSSFMLALAAGLKFDQEILQEYAFSGIFNDAGDMSDIDYTEQKAQIAQQEGKIYISSDHIDYLNELDYWLGNTPIPIPFLQLSGKGVSPHGSLKKLEIAIKQDEKNRFFSLKKLNYFFQLKEEDLYLWHKEQFPANQEYWENYILNDVKQKLQTCFEKIKVKKKVLHFAGRIASLNLGIGALLGNKQPAVIYHYQGDEYIPVIDLSQTNTLRLIKRIKHPEKEYGKIELAINPPQKKASDHWGISIYIASHNPFSDTKRYLASREEFNDNFGLAMIRSKDYLGDIPCSLEEKWEQYISEIYSLINQLQDNGDIGEKFETSRAHYYHFFLSMPVPMAFALGRAIGHFINATVYNFIKGKNGEKNSYFPALDLHKMRSPF